LSKKDIYTQKFDTSYKNIWKITLPIILGLVAQNIINVVDTIFLARVSELALGVGAIGGLYYFTFVIFGFGFGTGVQIIIGRRNGERKFAEIGKIFMHSLYIMLIMASVLFLFFFSDFLLNTIIKNDNLTVETQHFMIYRRWGIFFAFFNIVLRAFYVGVLRTNVLLYSTILMTIVNIVLDYGLIFGQWGMPLMGISGAALASVIAEISATTFIITWTYFKVNTKKYNLFSLIKPRLTQIKSLFRLSFPLMMQNFLSFGSWFTFFLIIEKMGERELAVSNIVRSIYMVLMIPVWGLSSSTHSIVSNLMGRAEFNSVIKIVKRITLLSIGFTIVIISSYIFIPEKIIGFYTKDIELINATVPVLQVVTFSLLLFSVSFIIFSAISGTGKTTLAFLIEAVTIFVYLSGVYVIGLHLKKKYRMGLGS